MLHGHFLERNEISLSTGNLVIFEDNQFICSGQIEIVQHFVFQLNFFSSTTQRKFVLISESGIAMLQEGN